MTHDKNPPTLPTIVDEAGDTPNWVPGLGFGLFLLVAGLVAWRIQAHDAPTPAPAKDSAEAVANQGSPDAPAAQPQ